MKSLSLTVPFLLALAVLTGCASTHVTSRQKYEKERLARPVRIIVHDFTSTPGDMPAWAATSQYTAPSTNQTAEDIDVGRKLRAEVTKEPVGKIQDIGLPAEQDGDRMSLRIGGLIIMAYFETLDPGSAAKSMAIGLIAEQLQAKFNEQRWI